MFKLTMPWALAALILFAIPGVASAQSGMPDFYKKKMEKAEEAKKKAEKEAEEAKAKEAAESGTVKSESASDDNSFGGNQVEQLMARKRAASAQMDAEREAREKAGSKIVECRRDTQIGSWHYKENKIVSELDGESYIFDAANGVIRTESGKTVATITEDGLDIPSVDAKVKLANGGGVTINGESCGKCTRQDLYIYGRRLGNFFGEAPREMVVFFLLHNYGQPEVRANMKRTQYMDGNFMNAGGTRIGYIKGGMIYNLDKYYPKLGSMHYDDDETVIGDNKFRVGAFQYDGTVNDNNGNKIGQVKDNGDILNVSGNKVAHVGSDGKITDASGKFLVQFSGERPVAAAVAYWFFFKDRIK